jgi:hypothetical protein
MVATAPLISQRSRETPLGIDGETQVLRAQPREFRRFSAATN